MTNTFDWAKVNWKTRAAVGQVVSFIFDDESRKVSAGQLGLVVWDAGKDENGRRHNGRDVLLSNGHTVNVADYELQAAGIHADCFVMPQRPAHSMITLQNGAKVIAADLTTNLHDERVNGYVVADRDTVHDRYVTWFVDEIPGTDRFMAYHGRYFSGKLAAHADYDKRRGFNRD